MLITFNNFELFNHSDMMNDIKDTESKENKDKNSHLDFSILLESFLLTDFINKNCLSRVLSFYQSL